MNKSGRILRGRRLAAMLAASILMFSLVIFVPALRGWMALIPAGILAAAFGVGFFAFGRRSGSRGRTIASFVLAVIFILAALVWGTHFVSSKLLRTQALADGQTHAVTGYISEVLYEKPYGAAYDVTFVTVDGKPVRGKARFSVPFSEGLSVYDTVSFSGVFAENDPTYDAYMKSRGIFISVSAEKMIRTGVKKRDLSRIFSDIRMAIADNFERFIGGDEAGFATALFTGNRDALDGQTRLAFRRLGISHLLAVSGLHLSIVVGGTDFLLRTLTVPKRKKNVILILLTLFFAAICGFSASIMRAAIMLCILYVAELLGERSDSVTSLFLAVTLILAIRPHAVFDAGLWLSFLSTFGILCVMPLFSRKSMADKTEKRAKVLCKRIGNFLAGTIMMSITATFFTMPVTYLLYGSVSLVSPLANLIFVPLTQLLLYLLAALSVLCFVPFLPELLGAMCRLLTDGIYELAAWASDFRGIYISIRYPFAGVILILLVIGIMILLLTERLRPMRILAVFLACTVAFGGAFAVFRQMNSERTDVFLQTDGKSDVVGFVDGRETVLVDITTGGYAVPSLAVDTLASYYTCEIDTFVLTHLHSYHAGMLKKLADKIKIHRILLPMAESEAENTITVAILSALDSACEVDYYDRNGEAMLETGSVRLYLPALQFLKRSSHPVVVFSADLEGFDGHALVYASVAALELSSARESAKAASLVICGAHGSVMKNIIDTDCLIGAEHIIFANRELSAFAEMELLAEKSAFAEDYGGLIRIAFEK